MDDIWREHCTATAILDRQDRRGGIDGVCRSVALRESHRCHLETVRPSDSELPSATDKWFLCNQQAAHRHPGMDKLFANPIAFVKVATIQLLLLYEFTGLQNVDNNPNGMIGVTFEEHLISGDAHSERGRNPPGR